MIRFAFLFLWFFFVNFVNIEVIVKALRGSQFQVRVPASDKTLLLPFVRRLQCCFLQVLNWRQNSLLQTLLWPLRICDAVSSSAQLAPEFLAPSDLFPLIDLAGVWLLNLHVAELVRIGVMCGDAAVFTIS
ncbi:hypothetical protein C5167_041676 [Papaver somniferum]|nr:hypothetical protein C5167_041676 [Papaver somniferum]